MKDDVPRTADGKVDRDAITEMIAEATVEMLEDMDRRVEDRIKEGIERYEASVRYIAKMGASISDQVATHLPPKTAATFKEVVEAARRLRDEPAI